MRGGEAWHAVGERAMQAELKSLMCSDASDPSTYRPGQTFCVWFQSLIGPKGEEGEESFQFCVCSPSWLKTEVAKQELLSGRFMLIAAEFNYDAIERYVRQRISEVTGNDWNETASKLARWMYWEFEDYSAKALQ